MACRIAPTAAALSTETSWPAASLPPQAGQRPYGKANPSETFWHEAQVQTSRSSAQQMCSSSPGSKGRRHFGQEGTAFSWAAAFFGSGSSSTTTGHSFVCRYFSIAFAARRPAPNARMTVAPPVTMSPPAKTPRRFAAYVFGSTLMYPSPRTESSGAEREMTGFARVPRA